MNTEFAGENVEPLEDRMKPIILPRDVKLEKLFFGKHEVEEAARTLVRFFQRENRWRDFTLQEFVAFCKKSEEKRPLFGLWGIWEDDAMMVGGFRDPRPYVVMRWHGGLAVTLLFLEKCKESLTR